MRIERLVLDNFQGIKHLEITPGGKDVMIRGDNAVGKTTVANAITWMLFDKPLDGAKSFSPKPKDDDGEDVHHIETAVEMRISVGKSFKKVLSENWPKKRGDSEGTFSGHTTDYFVDDVPKSKSEYQKALDGICPSEQMKVLMNPSCFAEELSWRDRRGILFDIGGDLSDADVIAGNEELEPLAGLLLLPNGDALTVSDLVAKTKAQMKKWNKLLSDIPVRIDELNKNLAVDEKPLPSKERMSELKDQKASLLVELSGVSNDDSDIGVKTEIRNLHSEIFDIETAEEKRFRKRRDEWQKETNTKRKELDEHKDKLRDVAASYELVSRRLKETESRRDMLVKEFERVSSLTYDGDGMCPMCHQPLPPDQIENAVCQFEDEKMSRLREIQEKGQDCSTSVIADLKEQKSSLSVEMQNLGESVKALEDEVSKCEKSEPECQMPEEDAKTILKLKAKIEKLEKSSKNDAKVMKVNEINMKIGDVEALLMDANKSLDAHERNEAMKERIEILRNELRNAVKEYEACEKTLFLCERFIAEKADAISNSINESFETVQFKLFDRQINGGLKECCDVMIPNDSGLVPWNLANNAARINSGIEIINVLSTFWKTEVPIIIDSAESVTKFKWSDSQMIKLVVDERYPELQVDVYENILEIGA